MVSEEAGVNHIFPGGGPSALVTQLPSFRNQIVTIEFLRICYGYVTTILL